MKTKNISLLFVSILFISCRSSHYEVTSMTATHIELTDTFERHPNTELSDMVNHYKKILDAQMNKVVGTSSQYMTADRPQSLLTNLTSDVMLARVRDSLHIKCDLAMMNVDGHRAPMPKGEITRNDVFQIYSFDNSLNIVKIKGIYLSQLFDSYAKMGGAGVSANVNLVIKDKKIVSALIDGKAVNPDKEYTLVTIDYLAGGNDGMKPIRQADHIISTGIILRNCMLDYIAQQTREGKELSSCIDKRIIVE